MPQNITTRVFTDSYSTSEQLSHFVTGILNSLGLNYGLEDLRFNCQQGHKILSYAQTPTLPLEPSQPPIQWAPAVKQLAGEF
jgi:hypothetical protein